MFSVLASTRPTPATGSAVVAAGVGVAVVIGVSGRRVGSGLRGADELVVAHGADDVGEAEDAVAVGDDDRGAVRGASDVGQGFSMTARPVSASRAKVGSSATTRRGPWMSARAKATRCGWPPESSRGKAWTRRPKPSRPRSAPGPLDGPQRHGGALGRGQGGQEIKLLEDESGDLAPEPDVGLGRHAGRPLAQALDLPGRGLQQAGDDREQGRFAAAALAHASIVISPCAPSGPRRAGRACDFRRGRIPR